MVYCDQNQEAVMSKTHSQKILLPVPFYIVNHITVVYNYYELQVTIED